MALRNSSAAAFGPLGIDVHEHEAIKQIELDRPYASQLTYKILTWYLAGHSVSEMLKRFSYGVFVVWFILSCVLKCNVIIYPFSV